MKTCTTQSCYEHYLEFKGELIQPGKWICEAEAQVTASRGGASVERKRIRLPDLSIARRTVATHSALMLRRVAATQPLGKAVPEALEFWVPPAFSLTPYGLGRWRIYEASGIVRHPGDNAGTSTHRMQSAPGRVNRKRSVPDGDPTMDVGAPCRGVRGILKHRGGPGDEHMFVEDRMRWERHLAEHGWTAVGWPVEYGGRGLPMDQEVIFHEEYARGGGPGRGRTHW